MEKKTILLILVLALCLGLCLALLPGDSPVADPTGPSGGENTVLSIQITEISAKNDNIIADNDGNTPDYIELYNSGSTISLAGFRLTDGKVRSEPFGDIVLAAGEYRVFYLSDELTGFGISAAGGETIQLLDAKGNIMAQVTTAAMEPDQVMLLQKGVYNLSYDASPGFANDAEGLAAFREGHAITDPQLVISEVLLNNVSSLPDENGVYCDVVELYNCSGSRVYLGSYFLTDNAAQRYRYRLPEMYLEADSYLVLYCDGGNYIAESGQIHTNFAISHGETLYLTQGSTGGYVTVTAQSLDEDLSMSLTEDGTYASGEVSLGYSNDDTGAESFAESRIAQNPALVISEVLLSSTKIPYQGKFQDVVEIYNCSDATVSTAGWYLSDGGDPYEYALPEMELAPGQYLVVICNDQTTGFSLSDGEALRLTTPEFDHAPLVYCAKSTEGKSVSRQDNNVVVSYTFLSPTPGYENTEENYLLFLRESVSGGLMISEMMSANNSYIKGAYSTTCDWIELYNSSDKTIDLSDFALTDDAGQLYKYPLPDQQLAPGEYVVILLSEENKNLASGYSVLPFNLSAEGEKLYLCNGGSIVDYVFLPAMSVDMAYGRPDGSITYAVLDKPTPKKTNAGVAQISADPIADIPQGSYDDVEYLDISFTGPGKIYYTTDCTEPTVHSTLYTGPIRITKTTVFRVIQVEDGKRQSNVIDLTYLVNENDTLGTICIVTDPDNLWDYYTGIYVMGPGASSISPYKGANFWKDWEKEATVSLFEADGGGFYSACGLKIFGGYSRANDKKSLVCFFRSQYGASDLDYPLFGEEGLDSYEAFVLRAGGQDAFVARMRDELVTSIASKYVGLAVQKYKPVVVYLNGKYYGLHYIREKINEHYVSGNFGCDPEDVTLCVQAGTNSSSYQSLISYVKKHDLSQQEHYDYVCSQIDIDNYIDYLCTQIWTSNSDLGNVKFFKIADGKWTWILYDTDFALSNSNNETLNTLLKPMDNSTYDLRCRRLASKLIKNEEFKEKFLTRLAWHINEVWTEENINAQIDILESAISADMVKDCKRWGTSYSYWQERVAFLRTFSSLRTPKVIKQVKSFFGLTDEQLRGYGFPV